MVHLRECKGNIVRTIMENAVKRGSDKRGEITDFVIISLDEKSYTRGHSYASILIDGDKNYVIEMNEWRKEEDVRSLFASINSQGS